MGTIKDQRSNFVRKCQNNVDHHGGRLPAVAAQEPDRIIHILFPLGLWGSQVDSYLESLSLPKLPSWLAFIMKPSQIFPTFSFRVCNNGRLKIVQQLFYSSDDVPLHTMGLGWKAVFCFFFAKINKTVWRQIFKTNVIYFFASRFRSTDFDASVLRMSRTNLVWEWCEWWA